MRTREFVFISVCVFLCGIVTSADALVDTNRDLSVARRVLDSGEAFVYSCSEHTGKCDVAGFENGEEEILFFKNYSGNWGHIIKTCKSGYRCESNNKGNTCVKGTGNTTCDNVSLERRCDGLSGAVQNECIKCSQLSNWTNWDVKGKKCNGESVPASSGVSGAATVNAGGVENAMNLCDTNLKDGMAPGQVKIIDCTKPEYADICYDDTKLQVIFVDYDGDCDEYEYECMSGYECVMQEGKHYYACMSGTGSPFCPGSYTFQTRCDGLSDELEERCEECTNNDWTAWDYENRVCGKGISGDIQQIADELKSISDGFGQSHWKNKDGGFNTARLASDSIAGVVLGTAGGLITSHIIKKNQVKGGFEDVQCTVSGQVVSQYGDEFIVGRQ